MQVNTNKFSWFQVPEDVKELLILAAQTWEDSVESEKYMQQAIAKTGDNPDVLVAAYRYFYYKNNYFLALKIAKQLITTIREAENFSDNWEELKPILVQRCEEAKIRLYLNAYAASGLVLAKLGNLDEAKEISIRIKQIDDKHDFGAGILLDILTRPAEEDE
ncbi:hypothetical protein [Richelia sinica]|uniref:hypothetical protein n=1 Tax=Richelia sinica TaxID=1357545 RepID=UPI0016843010|nr:hypothetical protein [Richelia sinica]MBD2665869.1 hypothetical protein [Richelia sinica FACHB-800]